MMPMNNAFSKAKFLIMQYVLTTVLLGALGSAWQTSLRYNMEPQNRCLKWEKSAQQKRLETTTQHVQRPHVQKRLKKYFIWWFELLDQQQMQNDGVAECHNGSQCRRYNGWNKENMVWQKNGCQERLGKEVFRHRGACEVEIRKHIFFSRSQTKENSASFTELYYSQKGFYVGR